MEAKELLGWVVAAISFISLLVSERNRRQDTSKVNMQDALKPLKDDIRRHSGHIARQFTAMASLGSKIAEDRLSISADINALTVRISNNEEGLTHHEESCIEHRARMESMFREIRDKLYEK